MTGFETSGIIKEDFLILKTLEEMSPKWALLAHFGDIFYNVINRRMSLHFKIETIINYCFYKFAIYRKTPGFGVTEYKIAPFIPPSQ